MYVNSEVLAYGRKNSNGKVVYRYLTVHRIDAKRNLST